MKKIVFIAESLSQPRIIKRIISVHNAGYDIKVYGYERSGYNCNALPSSIPYVVLGNFKDGGDYYHKIKQLKKDINRIIDEQGKTETLYYSFGFMVTNFLNRSSVRYIYELSDILYGYNRFNLVRPFFKLLDKKLIRQSEATVMTSAGFRDFLFGNGSEKVILQPNKLSSNFKGYRPSYSYPDINHLRFAFVGAVRYPDTILRFAKVIGKDFPQHEFHFYGTSIYEEGFKKEMLPYKNVEFHGKFKNPDDLEKIYNDVDLVVACYSTESLNERIAEPNKMYEAIYFHKPIIVSTNSFVGLQVNNYGCGFVINAYSDLDIKRLISDLSNKTLCRIIDKEASIPEEELIDNPDNLLNKINTLIKKSI